MTKKETESMTKKQQKNNKQNDKKYIAKELKKHMQKRYVDILRYLFSDTVDAGKNMKILIKNEPHFYKTIEQIKQTKDFQRRENEFRTNVDMEIPDVERYISDAKYQTILVGEALERIFNRVSSANDTRKTPRRTSKKESKRRGGVFHR